jgi:hypothetical protein
MNGFELVASLVSSLSWPAMAATLLIVFRHQLRHLVTAVLQGRRLKRVAAGPFELEWEEGLAAAGSQVVEVLEESGATAEPEERAPAANALEALFTVSPRAAIIDAARQLEDSLVHALTQRGARVPPHSGFGWLLQEGVRVGVLPEELVKPLGVLRRLRNDAVHGERFDVTPAHAALYVAVASTAVAAIRGASGQAHEDDPNPAPDNFWAL